MISFPEQKNFTAVGDILLRGGGYSGCWSAGGVKISLLGNLETSAKAAI